MNLDTHTREQGKGRYLQKSLEAFEFQYHHEQIDHDRV